MKYNKAHLAALKIDKENDIVIFDPSVINSQDIKDVGIKNAVRVRRPSWGYGIVICKTENIEAADLKELITACQETTDAET